VTGKDLLETLVALVDARAADTGALLGRMALQDRFLQHEEKIRATRRRLDRFRLEAHVRWEGKQMSLADAEDLLHAYGQLVALGCACDVEGLEEVVARGYALPADEDW